MERTIVTSKINSAEEEDKMNISHLVKERKRCNSHFVTKIEDGKTEYSKQKDIIAIFHRYFTDMFDDKSVHVSQNFNPNPIRDEFTHVLNEIVQKGELSPSQRQGIMALIKKIPHPKTAEHYRPITLLNTDYKILARIVNNRLKSILQDIIHETQFAGVKTRSVFDSTIAIRDLLAYHTKLGRKGLLISIDFSKAFDKIRHVFLFHTLQRYGFDTNFIKKVKIFYTNISSTLQINGHYSKPIAINRSVRKGCPLFMSLFVIALNPLLEYLHQSLTGLNLQTTRLTKLSYADDVNILLYNDLEIPRMWQILQKFEEDSGLNINISKSRVLPLGKWENPPHCPPLLTTDKVKILGVIHSSNWNKIQGLNWNPIVAKIKGKLQTSYPRENCLNNRILNLNTYILSLLWYVAQVIPIPMNYSDNYKQQSHGISGNEPYLGCHFQQPLREEGGLDFIRIPTKCASLLVSRYLKQQQTDNMAAKNLHFSKTLFRQVLKMT
ncbi:hypothetical protein ANN_09436 [Periplaneta americana]|uniref:Reverse transcriptase domain-containing protein n=1 Tax=Periplaneta americana TaxID=6978 RepID=A0ABQ8TLA6_PERAM|nr:hypothetical protein ANN_09436 [Periplaneta americana]